MKSIQEVHRAVPLKLDTTLVDDETVAKLIRQAAAILIKDYRSQKKGRIAHVQIEYRIFRDSP